MAPLTRRRAAFLRHHHTLQLPIELWEVIVSDLIGEQIHRLFTEDKASSKQWNAIRTLLHIQHRIRVLVATDLVKLLDVHKEMGHRHYRTYDDLRSAIEHLQYCRKLFADERTASLNGDGHTIDVLHPYDLSSVVGSSTPLLLYLLASISKVHPSLDRDWLEYLRLYCRTPQRFDTLHCNLDAPYDSAILWRVYPCFTDAAYRFFLGVSLRSVSVAYATLDDSIFLLGEAELEKQLSEDADQVRLLIEQSGNFWRGLRARFAQEKEGDERFLQPPETKALLKRVNIGLHYRNILRVVSRYEENDGVKRMLDLPGAVERAFDLGKSQLDSQILLLYMSTLL